MKLLYSPLSLLIAFLFLFSNTADLQAQAFMAKDGYVEFKSEVPLHSFKGKSNNLVGKIDLDEKTVDFYVDLATLKTGNEKRDKDMRETLEVSEYPFAEFFGELVTDFDLNSSEPQKATAKGEFTVHGVTNDIAVTGTLHKIDNGLKLTAEWVILLTDYDIEPPGILFYKVDDDQDVAIEIVLKPVN